MAILELLRTWFRKPTDDPLITLIAVAREDRAIARQLSDILKCPPLERQSLLNSWTTVLEIEGAPEPLVTAIHSLKQDEIAQKALEILRDADPAR